MRNDLTAVSRTRTVVAPSSLWWEPSWQPTAPAARPRRHWQPTWRHRMITMATDTAVCTPCSGYIRRMCVEVVNWPASWVILISYWTRNVQMCLWPCGFSSLRRVAVTVILGHRYIQCYFRAVKLSHFNRCQHSWNIGISWFPSPYTPVHIRGRLLRFRTFRNPATATRVLDRLKTYWSFAVWKIKPSVQQIT